MKRSIILLLCLVIMSLTGCAKLVSEEQETVTVTIIECDTSMMPVRAGKVTTYHRRYRTTIEYNGETHTISGSDTYNRYKDKIGETTTGTLEVRTYEDGSVKCDIVALE